MSAAADWDERYSHPNHVFGYRPNDFLKEQARFLRPRSRVLVLCDGEGRNGIWLAEQGHDVVSIDFSAVGLAKAAALAEERGVTIETRQVDLADWIHLPAAGKPWDAVVAIFTELPEVLRRGVADAATQQSAPGAVLIVEEFTPAQPTMGSGGPTDPAVLVTRSAAAELWRGWHPDIRLTERRMFEGMAHQGLVSVVQILGMRR